MRLAALAAPALLCLPALPALAQDLPATPGGKEALEILKQAIEVPTVQGRGKVPELAEMLAARFLAAGFPGEDVSFTPVGETGYLLVRYRGRDPQAGPVVLNPHMDVVEAKPEDWERDPFTAVVEDGFVFGRGALDDKGDLAMSMAAILELKREGWVPSRDLVFAASGDEETLMASTKAMAQQLADAELVLNADGGGGELGPDGTPIVYAVQAAEKTYADYRLTTNDPGGHSSRPGASNAIATMSAALLKIANYRFPPQLSPLTRAYWENTAKSAPPEIAAAMRAFAADPDDAEAAAFLSSKPEYVGIVRTTCVPTMVEGGHAPNALPQSVTANVNCRIFPGTSRAEVMEILAGIVDDPAISFELIDDGSIESPESPLREDLMAAVRRAVDERAPGLTIVPSMSAGASDSMFFRAMGIPSYGLAAAFVRPEDEYSHGLNERLPLATIDPGVRQWKTLLKALLD